MTVNGLTFYGTVDLGITYMTHGTPTDANAAVSQDYVVQKMNNKPTTLVSYNNLGNSKIGLKGVESLGGDWTALFKLETGFNPGSGSISNGIGSVADQNGKALTAMSTTADSVRAGQAFNQAAYAGVSHPVWGTLTAGYQTTLQTDNIGAYDPMRGAYAFSLVGFSGADAGNGVTEDTRWENAIKYLASFGPARLGVMYGFPGELGRNDSGVSADLGIDYAGISIDALYAHKKDAVAAGALSAAQNVGAPPNAIAGTVSDNDAYAINARYDMGALKLFGSYQHITFANPSSPLASGTLDLGGYVLALVNNTAYTHHKMVEISWVGARYAVNPKLELALGYYRQTQNSYKGNGCSNTSASSCSGSLNVLGLMADYHVTRRFDIYGGAAWSQALDGIANGYLHNNTIDPTIGIRYSF